ncbi:hypothetical protein SDC9_179922 [bioreactor metagenome]|uniref:Uncharacterized protein n=1 Tax=bioreactor metagenome TaxID=1076179 RepID=A0A645H839_9ZZZZ
MKPVRVTAAFHDPASELVNDFYFSVFHHIIDVHKHDIVCTQGLIQMVHQTRVIHIVQVRQMECFFSFLDTFIRQRDRFGCQIDCVILILFQSFDEKIGSVIECCRFFGLSGNDQWCAGFIDQDRIDFIHDRKVQRALHHLIFIDDHIVPQIIEAQFIIGAVGDVAIIGFSFFFR